MTARDRPRWPASARGKGGWMHGEGWRWRAATAVGVLALLAACRSVAPPAGSAGGADPGAGGAPLPSAGCRDGAMPALVGAAREVVVGGETRRYLVDAPGGAGDRPLPVVLAFHGFRDSAAGLRAGIGFAERAARGELIAVHADGRDDVHLLDTVGRGWDLAPGDTRDTAFVAALLDALERERCVDRRRVYATGFSNGGFFSNLLGCTLGGRLAAVAAVSGARALDGCTPPGPMPVLFFHGAADRVVPPRLTTAAAAWWRRIDRCAAEEPRIVADGCERAASCAADVVVCGGPQGHTWPDEASSRIWEFFRAHARAE